MTPADLDDGTAYYVGDPMCSWCWGYRPVLERVKQALPPGVTVRYVMGGLAKDSDVPMPQETRDYIQGQWRKVSEATGASFNWDFWTKCRPRRSTYPACRAVIAAGLQRQGADVAMFEAIQTAYYVQARNPSDDETLVALAAGMAPPLDAGRFTADLRSEEVERLLQSHFSVRRALGVKEFPSLILRQGGQSGWLTKGWADADTVLGRLREAARGSA